MGELHEHLQTSRILDQTRSFITGLHYCLGAPFADLLADHRKRPERKHDHQPGRFAVLYFAAGILARLSHRKKDLRNQNRKKRRVTGRPGNHDYASHHCRTGLRHNLRAWLNCQPVYDRAERRQADAA